MLPPGCRGRYNGSVLRPVFALVLLALAGIADPPWPQATAGLARAREGGQAAKPYSPPRTPWGDPDLQGTYTNKHEQSTPLERPEQFAGRRVEDVAGAELADVLARRNKQVLERAAGVGLNQFRDTLEVTKGSRAWLIVDLADGRIPPMTAAAKQRIGPADPFRTPAFKASSPARARTEQLRRGFIVPRD